MANYSTLKAAVAAVVKTNGEQAITGANMQTVLLSIINSIGGGYIFEGVATPSTNAGTPDQNVFYIGGAGTYANFGASVVVPPTNIAVFKYNGSWVCEQLTVENGGVFDISAFHAVGGTLTTYADLAAALGTNGANVPESVRKGGMSIKFVQSSDNKYVQYMYMGTDVTGTPNPFLDPSNWIIQGSYNGILVRGATLENAKQKLIQNGITKLLFTAKIGVSEIYFSRLYTTFSDNKYYVLVSIKYTYNGEELTIGTNGPIESNGNGEFIIFNDANMAVEMFVIPSVLGSPIPSTSGIHTYSETGISDEHILYSSELFLGNDTNVGIIAPPFNGDLIDITETTITIPANSRLVCNDVYYPRSSAVTLQRDTATQIELVCFNVKTKGFSIINVGSYQKTRDVYILFSVSNGVNHGCSLPYQYYSIGGKSGEEKMLDNCKQAILPLGTIMPVFTNGVYINITDETVVIPSGTRMLCGNAYYNTNAEVTINRTAGNQASAIVYNTQTGVFSEMSYSNYTYAENTYILFSISYDKHKACSLPLSLYTVDGKTWEERAAENQPTDVVSLNNPTVMKQNLIQQTYQTYTYNNPLLTPNILTLLWFTDVHGDESAVADALAVKNYYSTYINDWIHTGDSVNQVISDTNPFSAVAGANTCLNCLGNHEAWLANTDPDYYATEKQCYDLFIAPFVANWNVVQPTGAAENGYCYYYKDYTTQGFRLIVLDTVHWHTKDETVQTNAAQKTWFESVLADAKTNNLAVVCATHYPPITGVVMNHDAKGFMSLYYGGGQTRVVGDGYCGSDEIYDCVDTFISNGGEFITWLVGHTHIDAFGTIVNHANQNIVVLERSGISKYSSSDTHIANTKTAVAFNIITFDSTSKLLKITRVGNSINKWMQPKNTLCYKYTTKEIFACE